MKTTIWKDKYIVEHCKGNNNRWLLVVYYTLLHEWAEIWESCIFLWMFIQV